jgi:hypothetical protein
MLKRRRVKQTIPLQDRLRSWTNDVLEQAEQLPPGKEREAMLKKARHADTASHLSGWANSPGLQSPKRLARRWILSSAVSSRSR